VVAERKNVLSTLFFFLAIAAYAWYAHKPGLAAIPAGGSAVCCGIDGEAMVITLTPCTAAARLLASGEDAKRPPSPSGAARVEFPRLVLEKVPLLILSAASAWMTFKAQRSGMAVRNLYQFRSRFESKMHRCLTGCICGK